MKAIAFNSANERTVWNAQGLPLAAGDVSQENWGTSDDGGFFCLIPDNEVANLSAEDQVKLIDWTKY